MRKHYTLFFFPINLTVGSFNGLIDFPTHGSCEVSSFGPVLSLWWSYFYCGHSQHFISPALEQPWKATSCKKTWRKLLVVSTRNILLHVLDLVHRLKVSPVCSSSAPTPPRHFICAAYGRAGGTGVDYLFLFLLSVPVQISTSLTCIIHREETLAKVFDQTHISVHNTLRPSQPAMLHWNMPQSFEHIVLLLVQIYRNEGTLPRSLGLMVIFPSAELRHGFNGQLC